MGSSTNRNYTPVGRFFLYINQYVASIFELRNFSIKINKDSRLDSDNQENL